MRTIPIAQPYLGEAERAAVLAVLESGILAQGPQTADFERHFADACGVEHAVAVSSGTAALYIALLANGIGAGDEVITTPFTFAATANAILATGAKPVFVDIEEQTFNMDTRLVEEAITPRTKAILPVHLYGHMCAMDELERIAEQHGLIIVEDACQAVLADYNGRRAGTFGTGAFSFYATKNLTCGEGGMITTNDEKTAHNCRMLRSHGMQQRYHHETLGFNFRITELQAAIGLAQLEQLEERTACRSRNAAFFNSRIESVVTPCTREGYSHVWHQYTIRVNGGRERDAAVKRLNEAGIGTGIYYPIPVHRQPYMSTIVAAVTLRVAERMANEVISLPIYPQLSLAELERIVEEVNQL